MVHTENTSPVKPSAGNTKGEAVMEAKQSIQSRNDPITIFGERIARIEAKMDFVATHKDLAAMDAKIEATHTKIEATRTEIASLKGTLLAEIAGIKTLVADREASMQRWLLGITATTVVGMGAAMVGVAAALIWAVA